MAAVFNSIPAMILLTGLLVGMQAALLGTFLVLRGSAMLTDAIAHAIVFGIVIVWLLTGAQAGPLMIVGAAAAGVLTVALSEALARSRLVAMDAAIGLVFPALFATGVLLINLYGRNVHIDEHTVLLGEIGLVWLDTVTLGGVAVPVAVASLSAMLVLNGLFVLGFWKELKLAVFDPGLARALGFAPGALFYGLLILTSATAVASFDAVGAILFIAFVIVPPATAFLLTDRLGRMLGLAVALSAAAAVGGYPLAIWWDVSIGGMMASLTGVFFALALAFGPRHGLIAQGLRRRRQRAERDCRTLVVHLAAHQGRPEAARENRGDALRADLDWDEARARAAILGALDRGLIRRAGGLLVLTEQGAALARTVRPPDRSAD